MAYRKGLFLSFGIMSCIVSLDGAINKESSLKTLCIGKGGTEHPPVPIRQKLNCQDCGEVKTADLVKGKEMGTNQWAIIDATEVAEVRDQSLGVSKKALQLTPHPATDVDTQTLPGGSVYFLAPEDNAQIGSYSILLDAIERHSKQYAFLCQWSPVSKVGLWRLTAFDGVLALEARTWPEDVKTRPATGAVEVMEAHQQQMDMILPAVVQPFNADNYRDTYREALASLIANKDLADGLTPEGTERVQKTAANTHGAVDLSATLAAMLASVQPAAPKQRKVKVKESA